jgi:beta-phosphoglucomutase-like phosphatase (HAD superfamily)
MLLDLRKPARTDRPDAVDVPESAAHTAPEDGDLATAASVAALLADLRAEVRALRTEIAQQRIAGKTARQVRLERRHARLRDLANATGMGQTWACATAVLLILCGKRPAPEGYQQTARQLAQDPECPKSIRGLYRVIAGGE